VYWKNLKFWLFISAGRLRNVDMRKKNIIDTNLIGWFCRVSIRYRGKKNNNRIDLIFVVYTERVCKRWSTNVVPFHFTTVCCVSSQTEITHGNVAVLFSFSLVFTAIHELISCTWETSRSDVYMRTRRPLEMLNEPTVEYPFRYFFNFAVRRQNS